MHIRQDVAAPAQPKDNVADQIGQLRELLAPNWAPLEKLWPPGLCEQFMFMGHADGIYLYKHVDSRRYLNLDASGAPHAFNPDTRLYYPISVAAAMRSLNAVQALNATQALNAMRSLGDDEFLGTRRADLEKLFTRFELAAGNAPKAVRP